MLPLSEKIFLLTHFFFIFSFVSYLLWIFILILFKRKQNLKKRILTAFIFVFIPILSFISPYAYIWEKNYFASFEKKTAYTNKIYLNPHSLEKQFLFCLMEFKKIYTQLKKISLKKKTEEAVKNQLNEIEKKIKKINKFLYSLKIYFQNSSSKKNQDENLFYRIYKSLGVYENIKEIKWTLISLFLELELLKDTIEINLNKEKKIYKNKVFPIRVHEKMIDYKMAILNENIKKFHSKIKDQNYK